MPVNPTYLKHVSEAANWGRNWFIEAKGGASAFLGTPIGCGDVFDRVTPVLQIGVGKWFTPAIGGRIGFQGLSFKNAEFQTMKYQFVHADFLYNVTSGIRQNESGIPLWDVIPFVGRFEWQSSVCFHLWRGSPLPHQRPCSSCRRSEWNADRQEL